MEQLPAHNDFRVVFQDIQNLENKELQDLTKELVQTAISRMVASGDSVFINDKLSVATPYLTDESRTVSEQVPGAAVVMELSRDVLPHNDQLLLKGISPYGTDPLVILDRDRLTDEVIKSFRKIGYECSSFLALIGDSNLPYGSTKLSKLVALPSSSQWANEVAMRVLPDMVDIRKLLDRLSVR